tara:strand:- start:2088 stop:2288 length:201 start_codon:yes stop_codon:yes gene_type:complete
MATEKIQQFRMMRMRQLIDYCALSRATIYQKINEGDFPSGYMLSPGVRAWEREEIDAWLDQRKRRA